ncbi:putative ribonuclease H-like domain-containing protein, partial [Tanacetum coccineum]
MIGSLMYLTASRPDIMFAVCGSARFQVSPLKQLPLLLSQTNPFELEAFLDSDYAGASLDRKSTTGGCQFLGRRLISWQCKKQTIVANSTTEAEYVAAAHCCGQVLWIQNQMMDYGFNFMNTKIHIDNESTICVVKNPVYHSRTKHIEIRHHFIRDCYEKRLIDVLKIHTDSNVADLLTKGFDVTRISMDLRMDRCSPGKYYSSMVFNSGSLQVNSGSLLVNSVDFKLLLYSDKHNMVAFLKKPNESVGFTEVVDFLKGASLRYALTHNPTFYDFLVKQFWQTAIVRTLANGTQQLVASIDSKEYIITEASVRSKLQLADSTGIHNLSDAEIYVGLATLGYVTEGAAVDQGKGSAQPTKPHHTPVDPLSFTSQPPIPSPIPSPPHPSPLPHSPLQSPLYSPPHLPHQSPPFSPPHFSPPRSYEAPLPEGNTSGSAKDMLKLVKKVKSLETALKRKSKKVIISKSEGEESEDQGRKIDDDPLVSLVRESMKEKSTDFITPTKASGEAQEEDISPTILEAAKTLRRARFMAKKIDTGLDAEEEINTGREEINTGIEEVSTGSTKVDSGIVSKRGQREGKAPMIEEDIQNQGTWKLSQLKKLKFEEIKEEFDKLVHQVDTFIPINLEASKAKLKRYGEELQTKTSKKQRFDDKDVPAIGDKVAEVKEEEPVKRTRKRKKQKARKVVNVDKSAQEDSETNKEESVEAMNPTPLTSKSDSVVNRKIFQQGQRSIYQIMRSNGADTVYMSFEAMVKVFTREDLIELYRLVMQNYGTNRPEDAYDRVLWSDLKTMFDPPLNEDAIWSLPLQQKMGSYKFFKVDGVPDERKIQLASMHMFDTSLVWYQQYMKRYPDNTLWEHFEVEVVKRFGVLYEDPIVELINLKQTGSVQNYQEAFEALLNRVDLPKLIAANNLSKSYQLARIQEATNTILKPRYNTPLFPTPKQSTTTFASKAVTTPVKSNSVGQSSGYVTKNGVHKPYRLTQKELEEKRAKEVICEDDIDNCIDGDDDTYEDCVGEMGRVGKKVVHILIDCGIIRNFLDIHQAKKFRCKLAKTTPMQVSVANGQRMMSTFVCHDLKWSLQNECNFKKLIMKFNHKGRQLVLRVINTTHLCQMESVGSVSAEVEQVLTQFDEVFEVPKDLPPQR